MPSRVRFEWNGDDLEDRLDRAIVAAVDETTQAVDSDASATHAWGNRTGYGERHIIAEPAVIEGDRIRGRVGTTYSGTKGVRSAFYLLFLEYKFPWLRPAGDRQFPFLAQRIRDRFSR